MRTERLLAMAVLGVGLSGLAVGNCGAQESAGAAVVPVTTSEKVAAPGEGAAVAALPTTKALLARNDEGMGGAAAIAKASSRRMKGLYQTEDGSSFFSIEIFQKAPNKSLFKITLPNGVVVRDVCDGQSAWIEDAIGGYHQYEGAALASRLRYADFADRGKAFLLAATGKVTGQEKVGRHNTWVVEYTPGKNVVSRMDFDVDSGFVVHTEDTYSAKDGPYSVKLNLDDYREVDGLKVPYRMKRVEKGVVLNIRLVQVDVNAPIDDSIFLKPESAPK